MWPTGEKIGYTTEQNTDRSSDVRERTGLLLSRDEMDGRESMWERNAERLH